MTQKRKVMMTAVSKSHPTCNCNFSNSRQSAPAKLLRAKDVVYQQAKQLMALHDDLAEIKSEHPSGQVPSDETLDFHN